MITRYIVPVILLAVAAFTVIMPVNSEYKKIDQLNSEEAVLVQQISDADQVSLIMQQLFDKYNSFPKDQLDRLSVLFPDSINQIRLSMDMSEVGRRNGIVVKGLAVSQEKPSKGMPSGSAVTNVRFSGSATYDVLKEYIFDLERSLLLREITGFSFSGNSDQKDSKNPEYLFDMQVSSYSIAAQK